MNGRQSTPWILTRAELLALRDEFSARRLAAADSGNQAVSDAWGGALDILHRHECEAFQRRSDRRQKAMRKAGR